MQVLRIEACFGQGKKYRVCFDDDTLLCMYRSEIRQFHLKEGTEVGEEEYRQLIQDILIPRAKKRALHLLERQDRTKKNLLEKLLDGGYPVEAAEAAVSHAEQYHYIDDERYARQYVVYHKSGKSHRRLRMDLLHRGIDRNLADRILEEAYDTDETALIRSLMEKRRFDRHTSDRKERAKMFRYLAYRGFDSRVIGEAMRR